MEERSHFFAANVWSSLSESLTWQHSSVQQMCTHTPGMRAPGRLSKNCLVFTFLANRRPDTAAERRGRGYCSACTSTFVKDYKLSSYAW